jgi:hypothetical protein
MDDMRPENKYLHLMMNRKPSPRRKLCSTVREMRVFPVGCFIGMLQKRIACNNAVQCRLDYDGVYVRQVYEAFRAIETLTPFLDSLYTLSISFRNFYSAGIHTNHGLYATLYSFPAMIETEPDERLCHSPLFGLPTVLKKRLLQPFLYDA